MKYIGKLLVRDLKNELEAREIEYNKKGRKADLVEVILTFV